jgi:hypothetical protein
LGNKIGATIDAKGQIFSVMFPNETSPFQETRTASIHKNAQNGLEMVELQSTKVCSDSTTRIVIASGDFFPSMPLIPTRQSWSDTTSEEQCRGMVRISSHRSTTYAVQSRDERGLRILRTTISSIEGIGTQWGQPVKATGSAVGIDTLWLRGSPLRLDRLSGRSTVTLDFLSSHTQQHFTQQTVRGAILKE